MLASAARIFFPHQHNEYIPHAIKHRSLHWYSLFLVGTKCLIVAWAFFLYPNAASFSSMTAQNIIALVNAERTKADVPSVTENALLNSAAQAKLEDMLANGYFAHVSPTGATPWRWILASKYDYSYAGENLAMNFYSSEEVMHAWMQSSSHKKNILHPKYENIGIAVGTGVIEGQRATVVVQVFGKLRGPAVSQVKGVSDEPEVLFGGADTAQPASVAFGYRIIRFFVSSDMFRYFSVLLIGLFAITALHIAHLRKKHMQVAIHGVALLTLAILFIVLQFHFIEGIRGPLQI